MQAGKIALKDIDSDAVPHTRSGGLRSDFVESYAVLLGERPCPLPPIVVFSENGDGPYFVGDGWHRIAAAKTVGNDTIQADVRKGGRADALWFALGTDREHAAIPLTGRDKRLRVLLALQEFHDRSTTQIAEHVGCTQVYVSRLRREIEAEVRTSSSLPEAPEGRQVVRGKDGKVYPRARQQVRGRERRPKGEPSTQTVARAMAHNAMELAESALYCLKQIRSGDPKRRQAITKVKEWCDANI